MQVLAAATHKIVLNVSNSVLGNFAGARRGCCLATFIPAATYFRLFWPRRARRSSRRGPRGVRVWHPKRPRLRPLGADDPDAGSHSERAAGRGPAPRPGRGPSSCTTWLMRAPRPPRGGRVACGGRVAGLRGAHGQLGQLGLHEIHRGRAAGPPPRPCSAAAHIVALRLSRCGCLRVFVL